MTARGYRLFEVVGLELEYAVVDAQLRPIPIVADVLKRLAGGRASSDVVHGPVGCSNELATHVIELRNQGPHRSIARVERDLVAGVRWLAGALASGFGARLLPCGMHPLMSPRDTGVWSGAGRAIYAAYASLFPMSHGFLNVQSCHVNLPLGRGDEDAVLLMDAVACLMPYLPALAASSPAWGGRLRHQLDSRLVFYARNQARFPQISGQVVPEHVSSLAAYREEILAPMYRALRGLPEAQLLSHEWLNSRGAIVRFSRSALEVRVLDVQECVRMDVALAAFIRCAGRALVEDLRSGALVRPAQRVLVRDFRNVVRDGRFARVDARHLRRRKVVEDVPARSVLDSLLARAASCATADELPYLERVDWLLDAGSLAERLRKEVARRAPDGRRIKEALREVHDELPGCLLANEPWGG